MSLLLRKLALLLTLSIQYLLDLPVQLIKSNEVLGLEYITINCTLRI